MPFFCSDRKPLLLLLALAVPGPQSLWSQVPGEPAPSSSSPAVETETLLIPGNTLVDMELLQEVSTSRSKPDDFFSLVVSEAVLVDGRIAIPAKARAVGQVIDAQKSSVFGQPGKLLITIRYVEFDGQRVPMRLFRPSRGKDHTSEAMAAGCVPLVGLFALFVQGGEVVLPPGTVITGKVARDSAVPLVSVTPAITSVRPSEQGNPHE